MGVSSRLKGGEYRMDLNLKGKIAIVTGAGRGIGRAIALTFAREGAYVAVNDIDADVINDVTKEIVSLGSRALSVRADVTKPDQVGTMVSQTLDEFGKVDVLVNNAGIYYDAAGPIARDLFIETSSEEWHKEIDVILYGTLNCIKAVIDHMVKQKSGKIINISSDVGRSSIMGVKASIYSAAKAGVIGLTKSIAMEVASFGININAVCPGLVKTTRASMAEKEKETKSKENKVYENVEKILLEAIPLGRLGEPDEISKLVVFLGSDAASWITGQTYSINGGQMMI
jgi:3-oxoacyl-[acyl-carrier protein] reductase